MMKEEQCLWQRSWEFSDKPLQVNVGDLSLSILRLKHEWLLNYHWDKIENGGLFSCRFRDDWPEHFTSPERVVMETMSCEVNFLPMLADRPIVVRPFSPLIIPGNNTITLHVSTPVWLSVRFSDSMIKEFATQQLSDTWMGALTQQGELCYGSHTHARLDKDLLFKRPYRVLTPVTLHNKSDDNCTIERLSIPCPYLSIFQSQGQYITEPLYIVMEQKMRRGIVEIGKVTGDPCITKPRKKADRGILVSAWENLIA